MKTDHDEFDSRTYEAVLNSTGEQEWGSIL